MKVNVIYLTLIIGSYGFTNSQTHASKFIVKNNSQRTLEIKIMKQFAGIDIRYSKCRVENYDEHTEYFSTSGNYFLKI